MHLIDPEERLSYRASSIFQSRDEASDSEALEEIRMKFYRIEPNEASDYEPLEETR